METKLIEIRDRMTCFVALCTKPWPPNTSYEVQETLKQDFRLQRMVWRSGFKESRAIVFTHLGEPSRTQIDPFNWSDRTLQMAHRHIEEHWDEIPNGGLVDVQVIVGEKVTPAETEFSNEPI